MGGRPRRAATAAAEAAFGCLLAVCLGPVFSNGAPAPGPPASAAAEDACAGEAREPPEQWGPELRRWCCAHERVGCEAASAVALRLLAASPAAPRALASPGPTTTTGTASKRLGMDQALATAEQVAVAVGARPPPAPGLLRGPRISPRGCDTACTYYDSLTPTPTTASCKARIQWSTIHRFAHRHDACGHAFELVMQQCPVCFGCTLASAGCDMVQKHQLAIAGTPRPTAPPPPGAGLAPRPPAEDALPVAAAANTSTACDALCDIKGLAASCTDRVLWVARNIFEHGHQVCQLSFQAVWGQCSHVCSACTVAATGCEASLAVAPVPAPAAVPAQPTAAQLGPDGVVSTVSNPHDCTVGYGDWEMSWSMDKRWWCCQHASRGCVSAPAPPDFTPQGALLYSKKFDMPQAGNMARGGALQWGWRDVGARVLAMAGALLVSAGGVALMQYAAAWYLRGRGGADDFAFGCAWFAFGRGGAASTGGRSLRRTNIPEPGAYSQLSTLLRASAA